MKLRVYQRPIVAAGVRALTSAPRAQVVAASGSGKTVMGAVVSQRVAQSGRTLVLVPTLDLLWQTLLTYRLVRGGSTGWLAVCSAPEMAHHGGDPQAVTVSTSPVEVAALAGVAGPVVVLSTYASLPVVQAAHEAGLGVWDLVIVDEAHRTAGRLGKPWAAIHDDRRLPARRRFYTTATPKIAGELGNQTPIASMDDTDVFGKVAHTLTFGKAIDAGILADYRLVVPIVGARRLREALSARGELRPGVVDLDLLTATGVAMLRAAARYGTRRMVSFHSRLRSAELMAAQLGEIHELMKPQDRPDTIWTRFVSGKHSLVRRRDIFEDFRTNPAALSVLPNARVLAEGVDIPLIDGVCFADPKTSVIDIVQAVGRALRIADGAKATVIVPVFDTTSTSSSLGGGAGDAGGDVESAVMSSAFAPVWQTLRALRAHDERLDAALNNLADDPNHEPLPDRIVIDDTLATSRVDRVDLAVGISVRTIGAKPGSWMRGWNAARRYHRQHGHLRVPQTYVDADEFGLGAWIAWQRLSRQRNTLTAGRIAALNTLGMVWSPADEQWETFHTAAVRFHARHGHLAMAIDEVVDGVAAGVTMTNYRNRGLREDRRALLDQLDPWWDPPWRITWQRAYYHARAYRAAHGNTDIPRTHRTSDGVHLGEWLYSATQGWDQLHPSQRELLTGLGVTPDRQAPFDKAWQAGLAAARSYRAREGHLLVPQGHIENGHRLGTWINKQRRTRRNGTLATQRIADLDALDMIWDVLEHQWHHAYNLASAFYRDNGHLEIPQNYIAADGTKLGSWIVTKRGAHRNGTLSPTRVAALNKIGMDWEPPRGPKTALSVSATVRPS